jgi:hypothetical protein
VASHDLWIWHSFFGLPGSHNDINVLDRSPLFKNLLNGQSPRIEYTINGNKYDQGYYLADGIYPDWSTLIKTISAPQGLEKKVRQSSYHNFSHVLTSTLFVMKKHFAKLQEACRKDVERAFGVLQARFAIVSRPARGWSHGNMQKIMTTCVILHNMIIDDERGMDEEFIYDGNPTLVQPSRNESANFSDFIANSVKLRDSEAHFQLRDDLVKHLWALKGSSN